LRENTPVGAICKAEGGYFLVAETDGRSDLEFCQALAEAKGVVATPMSPFYATPFAEDDPCRLVRLAVCKSREHVQRACDALGGGGAV
jgi:aspartate/methionine/tyrosine aminotransferase